MMDWTQDEPTMISAVAQPSYFNNHADIEMGLPLEQAPAEHVPDEAPSEQIPDEATDRGARTERYSQSPVEQGLMDPEVSIEPLSGRWTEEENSRLIRAIQNGKEGDGLVTAVGSRTSGQIQSRLKTKEFTRRYNEYSNGIDLVTPSLVNTSGALMEVSSSSDRVEAEHPPRENRSQPPDAIIVTQSDLPGRDALIQAVCGRWTDEEDSRLIRALQAGANGVDLATAVGSRNLGQIRSRLKTKEFAKKYPDAGSSNDLASRATDTAPITRQRWYPRELEQLMEAINRAGDPYRYEAIQALHPTRSVGSIRSKIENLYLAERIVRHGEKYIILP
jgi:hypothetical protein